MERKPYPRDVSDDEWAFVDPSLTLMTADAPQRTYSLREAFNGWRGRAPVADDAERPPTVGGDLPTDPALDGRRGV